MYRHFQIYACILLMLAAPLSSAQQQEQDENALDEIVVTATRVPTPLADTLPSTAIITSEDIERIQPKDLGTLLSLKSGVRFRDSGGRGSIGGLFVRGSASIQVLVLIDGIRTASATNGATAIEQIPLESIERIEIIKGPMSGVYGADAIGGVIQIFTKKYEQEGSFATMKATAGSNQLRHYEARAGYGQETYSITASLSKESTDGIDSTEFKGGGNEDRDGFEQASENVSFSTLLQDDLSLRLSHVQSRVNVDYDNISNFGSSSKANLGKNWHQRAKLNTTSAHVDYDYSDKLSISGIFGASKIFRTDNTPDKSVQRTHFNTRKTDSLIQANYILSSQNQLTFGVDYQRDKVDSTTSYEAAQRTNRGMFFLWQREGDRSSTVLSTRHDKNDSYGSESNYSLQQSFDLSDQYQFVTSFGTAFRAPTFNDLYWPDSGNPDLKPEESKSFELSLRSNHNDLFWQINGYQTKVDNLIDWAQVTPGIWKPSNINKATLKGIEVELTREWNDYVLNASLDYLDAKDDNTGRFLEDRARASGSFELGKQIDRLYVGVDAIFEHSRFDNQRPQQALPGYALWGISAKYEYSDSLLISGHVDNLFDKEYVTNLAGSNNAYQNEGRTIEITLEYRF